MHIYVYTYIHICIYIYIYYNSNTAQAAARGAVLFSLANHLPNLHPYTLNHNPTPNLLQPLPYTLA
jgi:hypothetical protein